MADKRYRSSPARAAQLRRALVGGTGLGAVSLLAACGGGGGGGPQMTPPPIAAPAPAPTPTPTPAPAPAPTPTPTPTANYDTAEYRATVGAVSMNALAAYQKGATGAGINVGVIDSGIDLESAEFPGRISPASANVAGGTTVDDEGGHGTAVAFTIAGRRNGVGSQGVAFDATIVAARADTPGSCANTAPSSTESGCSFPDTAIAKGVDLARTAGARVINMSLGGSPPSSALIAAIGRATAAGIVVVISAGNDYDTDPTNAVNPDPFAQVANNDAAARGLVIIAGSINASDQISGFSNRAGNSAVHYLSAVGEQVRAPDETGTPFLWSGTSFSAPQISAAVALLAQAFPNLTGGQIVSILFNSARDAGDPGTDAIYGRGILDLTRAFQPLGATSVAGSPAAATSTVANAILSAPMGDARQGTLGAVILDGYSRAFAIDLARTIGPGTPTRTLVGALQSTNRNVAVARGAMTLSVTLAPTRYGAQLGPTTLTSEIAQSARAIAGVVTQRLGADTRLAFGFAQNGTALAAQLTGRPQRAFLVAQDGMQTGFDSAARTSTALRQQVGRWGITAAAETGDVLYRDALSPTLLAGRYRRAGYDRAALTFDRRFGALSTWFGATRLAERDTVLGARLGTAFGAPNATSWFVDGTATLALGAGWSLGGAWREGWTQAHLRAGLNGGGLLRTRAFAADLGKDGLFGRDSFGLRVAQPLRVSRGGLDIALPTNWDYATESVDVFTRQRLNLAPTGRELDVEALYARPLWLGTMQTNLFWRRDPGNFAALAPDYGAALRWSMGF